MRRGDLNHNSGRLLTALVLLFSLSIGNAWAGGGGGDTTYKTDFKATGGATGKGYVYASEKNSDTPAYDTTSDEISESGDKGENGTSTYYAWAKAVRGHEFNGWTLSNTTKTTDNSGVADVFSVTAGSSTVTGVVTANWTTYTKVDVTYNPSEDGIYSVTYQYNSYNSSDKTITAGDAENLSRNITSENGAQIIGSYYNDVITLQSVSGEVQGWYSNDSCTTELTGITNNGDGTYTYVAPQSGTASVYAKYPQVDKYYGRLTASIAEVPYSMPAGGMIFISKEASATPTYSENAQTVDNVGMGTTSLTYYLKAQPTDKRYVFRGWYDNAQCTGKALCTNKEYNYSFTASSTNSASPTTGDIYAAFDFNLYYMQVEATTGTSSEGLGMVLVRDNNTGTPEYGEYSNESSQFAYAYRLAPTATVYLYAKPKYGYKFSGWYDNPECTGAAIGTNNPQTYAATGTSTDPMNPDTTWLYAKFVEDATTVNITYNLPDQTKGEYTASVLDIQEIDDEYVWAFTEVFTSAGKTANTTQPQYKSEVLRLEAVCKAGYGVTSWTEGSTTKTTPSRIYDTSGAAAKTLGVTFGDAKPFMVCSTTSATTGTPYATLREALDNLGSNKMIRVVQNAYVPAGDYTIPDGVRLYILRADGSASKGKSVERSSAAVTAPTPYVTLTLGQGANIVVNGSGNIEAGAQIVGKAQDNSSASAGCNGAISGTYGLIVMSEGSTITLNGTSVLYAWGQITGKGRITANSGTTVYEIFQVTDWCGGSRAYACNAGASAYKMFPFSQYHIQNIEVPLRLKNGANEKLMAVIDGNTADDIPLVGPNNSSSMFRMNSSDAYIEKSYDAVNDRQVYRTGGTASINDFSMKVVITVSTTSFILPLTNNMSVYIESGTTSITTNAIVNADARIHIAEGATLEMASGKSLYVYDSDDWLSGFVFNGKKIAPIRYSLPYATSNGTSSGTPIRTTVDDAVILVNGTLDMKGKLYTSSGNAKIYSTATGKVKFTSAVADANTTVYHLNTISGSSFAASVATTYNTTMYPAKLQNGDGSFVMTANAAANDQFIYSKNLDKWMKNPKTITWNANGGTTEATTMAYSQGQFLGELPAAYKEGHTFAGWWTAATNGAQISATTKVTDNATYYAHWTPIVYNITYKDQGKAEFSSTHIDEPNAHPTKHTYGTTTTLNGANDKTGYEFGGWHTISNCKAESNVTSLGATAVSKDITLYAKWTPQVYTITYKDKDNAEFSGTSWASTQPTNHTYGTATTLVNPSKENYVFDGWFTSADCSGSAVTTIGATDFSGDFTLYAKWTPAVASVTIGVTTYYKTIADAFAAANSAASASTITVLQDATVGSEGVTYSGSQNCTLDLNGHTISYDGTGKRLLIINTGATFTITDNTEDKLGKLSLTTSNTTSTAAFCVYITSGTLQLEAGTVYLKSTSTTANAVAVRVDNSNFVMNGGTAQIEVTQSGRSAYAMQSIATTGTAEITVNDGNAIAKADNGYAYGTYVTGTMTVNGGKFHLTGQTPSVAYTTATSENYKKLLIKGGYYNTNANLATYVAPGKSGWNYYAFATTDAEKAEVGNDYTYKVAEAYNVTFNANGHGMAPSSQLTVKGQKAIEPTAPSVDGYTFGGWYKEEGCTNAWNFASDVVTQATTLYAKWTPQEYTITYKDKGDAAFSGTSWASTQPTTHTYGTATTLVDPSKEGHDFNGWYTDAACTDQHKVTELGAEVYTTDITLYAKWTPIKYTITWLDYNGEPLDDPTITSSTEYGGEPAYPSLHHPERGEQNGRTYEWDGWSATQGGAKLESLPTVTGDATYYAHYRIVKIVVNSNDEITEVTNVDTTTVCSGALHVAANLTTTNLILQATPISSGEITGDGELTATNAYFDFSQQEGFKARTWYSVAVPWQVAVPHNAPTYTTPCDIYAKNGDGEFTQLKLGSTIDLIYYDGNERAQKGPGDDCWRYVEDDGFEQVMMPGKAYMFLLLNEADTLRFVRKGETGLLTETTNVALYDEQTSNEGKDANWNGIANPATYHAYLNGIQENPDDDIQGYIYMHDNEKGKGAYEQVDMKTYKFMVGQAAYVQAPKAKSITVLHTLSAPGQAPLRVKANSHHVRYDIHIGQEGVSSDHVVIRMDENKEENCYIIGKDIVKFGVSDFKPQLWIDRYDAKLGMNTMASANNAVTYPLGISIPQAGEYTITPDQSQITNGDILYLTYDGRIIWNLTYAPYSVSLEKGTNSHYGIKLVRSNIPAITTDIDQSAITNDKSQIQKVLMDDQVYILRGGEIYTTTGQKVK